MCIRDSLVPVGKFNPIDYIVSLFSLPSLNFWNDALTIQYDPEDLEPTDYKRVNNTITGHDSESIIHENTELLVFQTSIVEVLILYIQLEQFQNPEYISTNLLYILDIILARFSELNHILNHIQNQQWNKVLTQWCAFIDYIVKESGSNCHEILTNYIYSKFNVRSTSGTFLSEHESLNYNGPSINKGKRETALFNFKSKSSSKTRNKDIKSKEVRPYHNTYQVYLLLYIVGLLLPFGVNFNSNAVKEEESTSNTDVHDTTADDDEFEEQVNSESSFIRDILMKLVINENSYIRNYALKALLLYAKYNDCLLYTSRCV